MLNFLNQRPRPNWLLILFALVYLLTLTLDGRAQFPDLGRKKTDTTAAMPWPADSLNRRTPRGTMVGFIDAVRMENYRRAGRYLQLPAPTPGANRLSAPLVAQSLQQLLDQNGNITPTTLISNDTTGRLNDDLAPNLDLVGTANVNGKPVRIFLERTTGPAGGPIWLVSAQTLRQIPMLITATSTSLLNRVLPNFLITTRWGGVPVGHWLAMLLLAGVAYLLAGLLTALAVRLIGRAWAKAREEHPAQVLAAFALPIRIYLTVLLFVFGSQVIGVSIAVRESFSEIIVVMGLVAILLLVWRLIDVFSHYAQRWLLENGQPGRLSAVLFLRRGIKLVIITFGVISVLDVFGWDVTTGLAALGIGGIALALGAQKTIENFVGSITIIADQPLRVGDFCKIDGSAGTVEQIGIRSTRLRTPNRTIVVIPNGQLASLKIENFAFRDRLLFNPTLQLRYETTPDQLRYLLGQLRSLLQNHPQINPNPARVRFTGLGENSLNVEIFAYVDTTDFNEFLAVQEELILRIMDTLDESGTGIAFPSQTVYVGADAGRSEDKVRRAEEKGRELRETGDE